VSHFQIIPPSGPGGGDADEKGAQEGGEVFQSWLNLGWFPPRRKLWEAAKRWKKKSTELVFAQGEEITEDGQGARVGKSVGEQNAGRRGPPWGRGRTGKGKGGVQGFSVKCNTEREPGAGGGRHQMEVTKKPKGGLTSTKTSG